MAKRKAKPKAKAKKKPTYATLERQVRRLKRNQHGSLRVEALRKINKNLVLTINNLQARMTAAGIE